MMSVDIINSRDESELNITLNTSSCQHLQGQTVRFLYAFYQENYMVELKAINIAVPESDIIDNVSIIFENKNKPNICKAFILDLSTCAPVHSGITVSSDDKSFTESYETPVTNVIMDQNNVEI